MNRQGGSGVEFEQRMYDSSVILYMGRLSRAANSSMCC